MALKDYHNTGEDSPNLPMYGTWWKAQTFIASSSYAINSVKLLLWRSNSPGTLTISIQGTSANLPDGTDIDSVTGTTDGDTLTTSSAGEWREITLSAPINLTSGTKYAIVARALSGDSSNKVNWPADSSSGYATGDYCWSSDSGSSWGLNATYDFMFETHTAVSYVDFAGTCAGVGAGSAAMIVVGLPSNKVAYKRLVAAGNDRIFYEDI